jgi:hypothetical protein
MPVKLSDELVQSAREEAAATERSITAQIEHWAKLGRAVEEALKHADTLSLKRSGGNLTNAFADESKRQNVHALLEDIVTSVDRARVTDKLRQRGKPSYETDPADPGRVVRIDPDGTRTPGHFENRRFVPASTPATKHAQ